MQADILPCQAADQSELIACCTQVYAEMGFPLDLNGRHRDFIHHGDCYAIGGNSFFVLRVGGTLAGTVALRELSPGCAELKRLYLLQRFQRHGFGRQLLQHAIAYARAHHYTELRLDTSSRSPRAIRLFEACGFQRIERYNDNPLAEFFYALDLTTPPAAE